MTTFVHSFSSRQVLCIDHLKVKCVGDLKDYLSTEKVKKYRIEQRINTEMKGNVFSRYSFLK